MTLKTYLVDGDKGGVGKSLTTRALAHYFMSMDENTRPHLAIIDADMSNPDVCGKEGLSVKNSPLLHSQILDLSIEQGWIEFANLLEEMQKDHEDKDIRVIVNMPAQIGARAFQGNVPIVPEVLRYADAFPVWLLSRLEEGIRTLEERIRIMPARFRSGLVLRNLFFGSSGKFLLWQNSALRARLIHANSGNEFFWDENCLPEINDTVITEIKRTPFHTALQKGINGQPMPWGHRLVLQNWLEQTHALFGQMEQFITRNAKTAND